MFKNLLKIIILLFSIELFIILFNINQNILPLPSQIINQFINSFNLIFYHYMNSITLTIISIIFIILISFYLGILIDKYKLNFLYNFINFFQLIPTIIIIPFFLIFFGFNKIPIILFTILIGIFPLINSIIINLKNISFSYNYLFKSLNQDNYLKYKIPYIFPNLLDSFIIVLTYSFSNVILYEYICGQNGLGYLLHQSINNYNISLSYLISIIIILTTYIMIKFFKILWNIKFKKERYV